MFVELVTAGSLVEVVVELTDEAVRGAEVAGFVVEEGMNACWTVLSASEYLL